MVLSFSAGHLDGFTYTAHGQAFASAMTGNLVLLGISLTGASPTTLAHLFPLLAFLCGVVLADILGRDAVRRHLLVSPHAVTLLFEVAVLTGIAFAPVVLEDRLLVALLTLSAAMQNASFRTVGTSKYNSIVMTGNLQTFSNSVVLGVTSRDRAAWTHVRQLGFVALAFLVGAVSGSLVTPHIGDRATLVPATMLAVVAGVLIASSQ